ncbi:enoyl-ACP reductase FabI [Secundilactobacillus similis]|uniref:Enoyl-[acyl-carrier-protein] reductase [NADH] n=1 Tax=Secundilactobacillus similis DSM 23365 = JCM 2765 TaxID=1423804 RepID=A0A0R2F4M1_9LACO|nr:enoyl-ACP reductase FabI [Secundilactobacillus similis]KRN21253.1 enoyl-(acyl carrier protein) reductase [Secundilactobacillus similis DSM 23365 = JCM 2765]
MTGILEGKKIIIMGVANKRSLAYGCFQALAEQGAQLILTYQNERMKRSIDKFIPEDVLEVECDVSEPENVKAAFDTIKATVGNVDGIIHAIAYADPEDLSGQTTDAGLESFEKAQAISVYSLISAAKYGREMMNEGGSIVTLTYMGSERAVPNYNIMGIAKAGLESTVRYLARDLAVQNIRVNAISAGAIKTLAVTGVKDYNKLIEISNERAVNGEGVTIREVGDTAAFLLSPLSTGVVGDVIYVDKGTHLM